MGVHLWQLCFKPFAKVELSFSKIKPKLGKDLSFYQWSIFQVLSNLTSEPVTIFTWLEIFCQFFFSFPHFDWPTNASRCDCGDSKVVVCFVSLKRWRSWASQDGEANVELFEKVPLWLWSELWWCGGACVGASGVLTVLVKCILLLQNTIFSQIWWFSLIWSMDRLNWPMDRSTDLTTRSFNWSNQWIVQLIWPMDCSADLTNGQFEISPLAPFAVLNNKVGSPPKHIFFFKPKGFFFLQKLGIRQLDWCLCRSVGSWKSRWVAQLICGVTEMLIILDCCHVHVLMTTVWVCVGLLATSISCVRELGAGMLVVDVDVDVDDCVDVRSQNACKITCSHLNVLGEWGSNFRRLFVFTVF